MHKLMYFNISLNIFEIGVFFRLLSVVGAFNHHLELVILVRKQSTYLNNRDISLTSTTFKGLSVFILLSYSTNRETNIANEDKINRMYTLVKVGKVGGATEKTNSVNLSQIACYY